MIKSISKTFCPDQKFRVRIPLSHYLQENKEEVVSGLLDWLTEGDEVLPLIQGFLGGYMVRRNTCGMTLQQCKEDI